MKQSIGLLSILILILSLYGCEEGMTIPFSTYTEFDFSTYSRGTYNDSYGSGQMDFFRFEEPDGSAGLDYLINVESDNNVLPRDGTYRLVPWDSMYDEGSDTESDTELGDAGISHHAGGDRDFMYKSVSGTLTISDSSSSGQGNYTITIQGIFNLYDSRGSELREEGVLCTGIRDVVHTVVNPD